MKGALMSPFTPAGERARWRIIYDHIRGREIGDVITYDELAEALDLEPVKDRHTIQLAMRRAAAELETADKRVVDAVPNVGYRIIEPEGQLVLARRHQRKSNRSLARGRSKAENVDFNLIPAETRKAFEVVVSAIAMQQDFNRRLDIRQRNLEQALDSVTKQTGEDRERTDAELAELRARLERLEQKRTSGSD